MMMLMRFAYLTITSGLDFRVLVDMPPHSIRIHYTHTVLTRLLSLLLLNAAVHSGEAANIPFELTSKSRPARLPLHQFSIYS